MKALLLLSPIYCILATCYIANAKVVSYESASSSCEIQQSIADQNNSDLVNIGNYFLFTNPTWTYSNQVVRPITTYWNPPVLNDLSHLILSASKRGPPHRS